MAGAVLTPLDVLWQWLAGDRSAFRGGAYHAPKPASSPLCCPGLIRHWGGVLGSTRGGRWEGLLGGTQGAPASPPQGLAHRLPRAPAAEGGRAEVCQQPWGRSLFAITGLLEAGREREGLGAVRGRQPELNDSTSLVVAVLLRAGIAGPYFLPVPEAAGCRLLE